MALLRRVPLLEPCTDRELTEVSRHVDEKEVPAGFVLTRQGATGRQAFVIVEGWAAVTIDGEPVAALGPGEVVGEVAMLDHGTRTATVVAKSDMQVLVVGPEAFPEFAAQPTVARGISRSLAERLRQADQATWRRPDLGGGPASMSQEP